MPRKRKVETTFEAPDAQEVVNRLKTWVVEHRPHTPFPKIAEELGLPLARFKKAMRGKDALKGFKWDILDTLSASEQQKDGSVQPEAEHPAKEEAHLSIEKIARLRPFQLRIIDQIKEPVFCSITGQDISPHQCLEIQGQADCFGCSAGSRLCEQCRVRPLAFPEVELCSICLSEALESEESMGIPQFPKNTKVECPLAGKKIGVSVCREMQNQSCGTCDAESRICQTCKARPAHYNEYGTCITCAMDEYGGDWLSNKDALIAEDEAVVELLESIGIEDEDAAFEERVYKEEAEDESSEAEQQRVPNLLKEVRELLGMKQKDVAKLLGKQYGANLSNIENGKNLPSLVTALRLEIILGWSIGRIYSELKEKLRREMFQKQKKQDDQDQARRILTMSPKFPHEKYKRKGCLPQELIERALNLISESQSCGKNFLSQELQITETKAEKLQQYLLKVGVIGPAPSRGKRRLIYITAQNLQKVKSRLESAPEII